MSTDNHVCCSLVNLSFSSENYEIYEHQEMVCITVNYDKHAHFDMNVEITQSYGTATSKLYNYIHNLYHITVFSYLSIMSGIARFNYTVVGRTQFNR